MLAFGANSQLTKYELDVQPTAPCRTFSTLLISENHTYMYTSNTLKKVKTDISAIQYFR